MRKKPCAKCVVLLVLEKFIKALLRENGYPPLEMITQHSFYYLCRKLMYNAGITKNS